MPARLKLVLIGAFMCALAAIGGVWVAALSATGNETPRTQWAGALRPPGAMVPQFALLDQEGERVTPPAEPTIYTFLYSTCEDTCPLQVQQIRGALDDLGHDVPVLAFAVDPPRDTPQRARRFVEEQRMTGRMRFLTGPREELRRQWRAYGIRPQGDGFEHTAHVVLLDRRGVQRIGFPADKVTPEGLASDLRALEGE